MAYNVLILEDMEKSRQVLISMLRGMKERFRIFETDNIDTAYRYAVENTIHIFLLDIVLDTSERSDTSGMNFAQSLLKIPKYRKTPVVFITSLEDQKLFAYSELHCYQYIEKPYHEKKVMETIREALELSAPSEDEKYSFFKHDRILHPVKTRKIKYIVASKPTTKIFIEDDYLEVFYIPINKLLDQLGTIDFVQCSRNTLVNLNQIEYIDYANMYIKIKNQEELITIGSKYKKDLLNGNR